MLNLALVMEGTVMSLDKDGNFYDHDKEFLLKSECIELFIEIVKTINDNETLYKLLNEAYRKSLKERLC